MPSKAEKCNGVILFSYTPKESGMDFFHCLWNEVKSVMPGGFTLDKHLHREARMLRLKGILPGDEQETTFSVFMKVEKSVSRQHIDEATECIQENFLSTCKNLEDPKEVAIAYESSVEYWESRLRGRFHLKRYSDEWTPRDDLDGGQKKRKNSRPPVESDINVSTTFKDLKII
jgi:hypothetical protein